MSDDLNPQVEGEAVSMDDTIANTLNEIRSRSEPVEPPKEPEAVEAKEEAKAEPNSEDRPRDESGRFTKRPKRWRKEALEKWDKLAAKAEADPELQEALPAIYEEDEKRDSDFFKGIEQYKDGYSQWQEFQRAITPFQETISALGATPTQAAVELLKADHILRYGSDEQKQQALNYIFQSYGLQPPGGQPEVDPRISALHNELMQVKGYVQRQMTEREQIDRQKSFAEVEKFKADPSKKHFEAVRENMAQLLERGLASDLNDAYEKAIWLDPQIRAQQLADQQAEAAKQHRTQAEAARKSAVVNVKPKGFAAKTTEAPGTIEDTIRKELLRLRGG